jgi:S1-C subfamily serine protease
MRTFKLGLALFLIVWGCMHFFGAAGAAGLADLNRQIDETNFLVNRGCSGTLIDREEGLILTAAHCIDQQYETVTREEVASDGTVTKKEVRVTVPGSVTKLYFDTAGVETREVKFRMEVVGNDLALIKTLDSLNISTPPLGAHNGRTALVSCVPPLRGEEVYIVGNPMGDLYSSVNKGIVSSLNRTYETIGWSNSVTNNRNNALMQISGGVVGGNSGGSVYNTNNQLIGVPVLGHQTNEVIAFAVPQPTIVKFLKTTLTSVPMKKAYQRIMGRCETGK